MSSVHHHTLPETFCREWYLLLVNWLVGVMGLDQCKAEPCVFCRIANKKVELMFGVHVDDTIVCGEKEGRVV